MISNTLDRHISIDAGISGGKPHISGRRITVQNIVVWHQMLGKSADEIAIDYDLSLSDVYAALAYYFDHRAEIDEAILRDDDLISTLKKETVSKLKLDMNDDKK